jgi:hypothetical protein
MEALDKSFILAGITNEAGVVLDGCVGVRSSVRNKILRYTCPSKKYFGNLTLGTLSSLKINV